MTVIGVLCAAWVLLTLLVVPVVGRMLGYGERRRMQARRATVVHRLPPAQLSAAPAALVPRPRTWEMTGNTVLSQPQP